MTSVVLFGSMGVAVECLYWLRCQPHYDVLGVVCSRDPMKQWRIDAGDRNMADEAAALSVQIFTLDDMPAADIGLSVRFHQMLRRRHLKRFRLGVVNLHGAPLPEMRGSMCEHIALHEGHSSFGASLHWMDEGVDSGDLLVCERFPIGAHDDSMTLLERANELGAELIKRHFGSIARGALGGTAQGPGRTFTRASATAMLAARQAA